MAETLYKKKRSGITMTEIVIVVAISSMVMTMAMLIMNRTTRHFKKGTDMLNVQRLMDNIVELIRTDVRSLKRIIPSECNDNSFSFFAIRDGAERKIRYTYDKDKATLFRNEQGKQSNFHGSRQVKSFLFKPQSNNSARFEALSIVMQLISDEKGGGNASTLSIVCQFYSTCVESELKISNLRKMAKTK